MGQICHLEGMMPERLFWIMAIAGAIVFEVAMIAWMATYHISVGG